MANTENTVTIYQNGIAAFDRVYKIEDTLAIKLPFKKDSIGDVAATLSILGPVDVVQAPNYSTNKDKPALEINPGQANFDIFTKLSGAEITVSLTGMTGGTCKGRVMGYQTENNVLQNGQQTTQHFLTVLQEDKSLRRLNFNTDVNNYTFTDPTIQALINKALDYNVEKVNAESVYMNCTVKPTDGKPCSMLLQYTVPNPAFKVAYRLKQNAQKLWKLYGYGVVDNNSDEDWNNFNVNCATGQPVTFATDIADIRIPNRQKINLVNNSTVGAVEAESAIECLNAPAGGAMPKSARRSFAPASAPAMLASTVSFGADFEEGNQAIAQSVEIGDSTIFKGTERVTIPAKKSALVKIIDLTLTQADSCLYYQPAKSADRLMCAIRIMNEATFTLVRGPVAIQRSGSHVGSAILSLSKPTEQAMLCYAQETGVKVIQRETPEKKVCQKHTLAEAVLISEFRNSRSITYTFNNMKEESFTLYFDHQNHYSDQTATCTVTGAKETSKLKDNTTRYTATIPAKGTLSVTIDESVLIYTTVKAGEFLDWMVRNPTSPLLKSKNLQDIVQANKSLEACAVNINTLQTKLATLKSEQDRIRKNCETLKGAGSQASAQADTYLSRLVKSDEEINTIEHTTLPKLNAERVQITNHIRELVARSHAQWNSDGNDGEMDRTRVLRSTTTI